MINLDNKDNINKKKQTKKKKSPDEEANKIISELYKQRELEVKEAKEKLYRRKLIIKKFEDFERKRILTRDDEAIKPVVQKKQFILEEKPDGKQRQLTL